MKWQKLKDMGLDIFKKRTRSRTLWIGGSLGIFSLFAWIVLLSGVSVTYTGDIFCEEECVSYINVTSTYWRICFADDFNLVQTNPDILVDVYVPARGKGNWRLFDASKDCIERKSKYNPLPNRFKIVGHKEPWQTVEWSVDRFDVDPKWIGDEKKKSEITYTHTTKKSCLDGTCNLILHSGTRYGYEDERWKPVENLKSFVNSTNIKCVVDSDGKHKAECLDWNNTHRKIKFDCNKTNVPVKINNKTIKTIDLLEEHWIEANQSTVIHFGEKSTTIILKDNVTENLDDVTTKSTNPDTNYDGGGWNEQIIPRRDTSFSRYRFGYIKFNISSIPSGSIIDEGYLYLYGGNPNIGNFTLRIYNCSNITWKEENMTWNNQPCGESSGYPSGICSFATSKLLMDIDNIYHYFNVTDMISSALGKDNITLVISGAEESDAAITFDCKENTVSQRPYLNITYSEGGDTCDCSSIQAGTVVDCTENCDITANCDASGQNIIFDGAGTIPITANITNYGNVTIRNSCNVVCSAGGCFK